MDGVLFDSTKLVSDFMHFLYPTLTPAIQNEMWRGNFHEQMEKFRLANRGIEETPEEKINHRKAYAERKMRSPLFEGIMDLLQNLRKDGKILTINTSAFEKNCLPLLQNSKTDNLFDFVATAEISKNKSDKFEIISQKFDIPRNQMVFVTDTVGDIKEAAQSGVPTIAVTWGAHDRSFFENEKYDNLITIVDTVKELEDKLLSL